MTRTLAPAAVLLLVAHAAAAQAPRPLMPIDFTRSAEFGWLQKPVHARRTLDDFTSPATWRFSGTGQIAFPAEPRLGDMRVLRVDMQLFRDSTAPNRARLPSVNLRRAFGGEDWRAYNRISLWFKPEIRGVPTMPFQIILHNDGAEKVPDRYGREGHHYVTFMHDGWQQVVWEIEPLARDRVTAIEIGYWVNKMIADPGDHMAFEIGGLELQRVDPDRHTGWDVGAGKIAFSHSGYLPHMSKTAVASGLAAAEFELLRVNDVALGEVVLRAPVDTVRSSRGTFQQMDFSAVTRPGEYVLRAGGVTSRPFAIAGDAWKQSIWKTLNFYYGNRCGYAVPGLHGVDHLDWMAKHGDQRVTMAGGWHDAGDLSQGLINTGEGTYALFALAEELRRTGDDPLLLERVLEEARWGLDWVLRVRFDGGYRVGFGSNNIWTNNVVGDMDDRVVEAKNNPNANYIAAAAAAIAYNVLRDTDPVLAARSLRIAEDDWAHAIVGIEGPSTWHTPAFAASRMELAGIGITASLELWRATGKARYRDKAVELARVIVESQQRARVGTQLRLNGFFYTGPDRDTIFHQFHRAADQAPIVALAQLVEAFPAHPDWMTWYGTIARYAEYQKETAALTAPWNVLPAYVYRLGDSLHVATTPDRYGGTRDAYVAQVRAGTPMGGDWYLRVHPVWYGRRGNYGVLLSQAKALSVASRLRGDSAGLDLAQRQLQWIVGRNPFTQSTMYGEGYDWAQQYSVSTADFVGSLPVGMQSRGVTDFPYWPSQNMYVYKEVWIHPSNRWVWLMADLLAPESDVRRRTDPGFTLSTVEAPGGATIRLAATTPGTHTYVLRAENLRVESPVRSVTVRPGAPTVVEWRVRVADPAQPWHAVVMDQESPARRREVRLER